MPVERQAAVDGTFLRRIILTNIKDFWEWHSFPPSTTVMAMPPLWEQIHV